MRSELPRLIRCAPEIAPVWREVPWPTDSTPAGIQAALLRNMAKQLPARETAADLAARLGAIDAPVVLHSRVFTDRWSSGTETALRLVILSCARLQLPPRAFPALLLLTVDYRTPRNWLSNAPATAKNLPSRNYADATHPRNYRADPGLVDAVNTALLLRQPLLVTGEPGTGKTQLAASISWELGLGDKPLRFDAKSHSKSRDLLYSVDTLSWFQVAHSGIQKEATALDFITYNALGLAILFACEPGKVARVLPKNVKHPGQKRDRSAGPSCSSTRSTRRRAISPTTC